MLSFFLHTSLFNFLMRFDNFVAVKRYRNSQIALWVQMRYLVTKFIASHVELVLAKIPNVFKTSTIANGSQKNMKDKDIKTGVNKSRGFIRGSFFLVLKL